MIHPHKWELNVRYSCSFLARATFYLQVDALSDQASIAPRIHVKTHKPRDFSRLCYELILSLSQFWLNNSNMNGNKDVNSNADVNSNS